MLAFAIRSYLTVFVKSFTVLYKDNNSDNNFSNLSVHACDVKIKYLQTMINNEYPKVKF
jgi:hypothetical protein